MDVIYGLIPLVLLFGFLVVMVFIYMAKSGQFDDLDGAANSIFMEDEYEDDDHKSDHAQGPPDAKSSSASAASRKSDNPSRSDS